MDKFSRNYELLVQKRGVAGTSLGSNDVLHVQLPFTIEFDVERQNFSGTNHASIRVYNLSEINRNDIRFDAYDFGRGRLVQLRAGYGDNLPIVFTGTITQAYSYREGVNFITQIEADDMGFASVNSKTNKTFIAGTEFKEVLRAIMLDLQDVAFGAIGDFPGTLDRNNTYSGTTVDLLRELSGGAFFVDNLKSFCLKENEVIPGNVSVINSASGLLGPPIREQTIIHFDILFEPGLIVGQKIKLDSTHLASVSDPNFNSFYKVTGVHHRAVISEAVCGDAVTTITIVDAPALAEVPLNG